MGSPEGVGLDREHPQRSVTLSPYELQKTEVTVGDYRKFHQSGSRPDQQLKFVVRGCSGWVSTRTVEAKVGEAAAQTAQRARQLVVM